MFIGAAVFGPYLCMVYLTKSFAYIVISRRRMTVDTKTSLK